MQEIKVVFFAGLKDVFGETMLLKADNKISIGRVLVMLIEKYPQSEELLLSSRFAIKSEFVELDKSIENGPEIIVLPPSSGG